MNKLELRFQVKWLAGSYNIASALLQSSVDIASCWTRDAGTAVAQGGSKGVKDNANFKNAKQSLRIMLVSVQQWCWSQK